MSSPGGGNATQARVRMVAQAASVPAVRRFVDDALTAWGRADLVDDVGLSVTELATNATLHSQSSFFDVELTADDGTVRLAVVDGGAMPASSIASRAGGRPGHVGDLDELDLESMTGRGLFIVSALASRWGIDDLPSGTRVWADFFGDDARKNPPVVTSNGPAPVSVVDHGVVIHLLDCPARLLLAHDDHLADLARDLGMFAASHADAEAAQSVQQIVDVVRLSALSWDAARLVATQAVREGRDEVDVAIAVGDPADLPRKVEVLQKVTATADEMAADGLLITMPASPDVRSWREWVAAEMTEQVLTGRAPRPYRAFVRSR